MPFYTVGDLVEIVFRYSSTADSGSLYINRTHWRVEDVPVGDTLSEAEIANGAGGFWGTGVRTLMHTNGNYNGCLVQGFPGGIRTAGTESAAGVGAGARSGTQAPPSVAAVLKKRTASAGRKYRGRLYLPVLSGTDVADGKLSAAFKTAIIASLLPDYMINGFDIATVSGTANVRMCVCETPPGGTPVFRALVTEAIPDNNSRTQRRRQVGKGS